jgi:YVTN family beta-propeller protein
MFRKLDVAFLMLSLASVSCGQGPRETSNDVAATRAPLARDLRDVLLVGNSGAGTVSFIDGHTFESLGSLNVIPDLADRMAEINGNLIHRAAYALIKSNEKLKHFEPSDGDRFVDDLFLSPDGTKLYVSRSNLGDVVAFDLADPAHPILWRHDVPGYHADHATLSPDGRQLVVSATLADKAEVLDASTGTVIGSFATGHYPHQNDYSADGRHIYNGSIGDVGLPSAFDWLKGFRLLTVVNAQTLRVERTYFFQEGIRPSVITADEKTLFAQLSYLNGIIKFDLTTSKTVATVDEPLSAFAKANYPTKDDYPHNSAHHGLALSGDGTKLCDVGTIDNTVSIITTADMTVKSTFDVGLVPYWATTSVDGGYCFVSVAGDNAVSVIDYSTGLEVKRVPVGKYPQRNRLAQIPNSELASLTPSEGG